MVRKIMVKDKRNCLFATFTATKTVKFPQDGSPGDQLLN